MSKLSTAVTLEARALRLFLAQGSYAERGLLPAATPSRRRMLATDIDVLVSEYGSGFHLTRRHVECKSGKFSLLDRVLWLHGVRRLLRADSTYLIASDVDLSASEFARALDVELFTEQHLSTWENALGIPADSWPCRSNAATFDAARRIWTRSSAGKTDAVWRLLRAALAFIEVESWLQFRYRGLNKLLRLLDEVSQSEARGQLQSDQALCARYVFSALLVRLAQYLLAICADVAGILPLEVDKYLSNRMVFGDQDPTQAAELTTATVTWVREALRARGVTMPSEVQPARLHAVPFYTKELVGLVQRLSAQPHEARYLPLAIERMQFGLKTDDKLKKFRAAAVSAETLAALLKAFVARTFKVSGTLAAPLHSDLIAGYGPPHAGNTDRTTTSSRPSRRRPIAPQPSLGSDRDLQTHHADPGPSGARAGVPATAPPKDSRLEAPEPPRAAHDGLLPMTPEEQEDG